jgi:hypothetical protein
VYVSVSVGSVNRRVPVRYAGWCERAGAALSRLSLLDSMPFLFCGPFLLQNQNPFVDLFASCQFDFQYVHTFTKG